ncbi:hypothetical protein SteCoe_30387 [Stentor coeruleus]|uniref:Uncharacterized protein n=1 Tax=Stentor coeruleus TaxID=5963 RepID=A0A1R2B3P1_9CILI|nr:hypothetical protein SteCoe_30387 [Stentor coeruleus]
MFLPKRKIYNINQQAVCQIKYPPKILSLRSPVKFSYQIDHSEIERSPQYPTKRRPKSRAISADVYAKVRIRHFTPLFHNKNRSDLPSNLMTMQTVKPTAWEENLDLRSSFNT